MCTRTLFVGEHHMVITGRNMDWKEDMSTNLWAFPAGLQRDGGADEHTLKWVSKYGSVVASAYELCCTDGMNEKGLVASLLYLAESDYGEPTLGRPQLVIGAWAQYVLDLFATVAEAVTVLAAEPFQLVAPDLPTGQHTTLHLAISDPSGDSAIFEYIEGRLSIHHGKQYKVMTNSPTYDKQVALNEYWEGIGGLAFLPGTNRAADRFVRASFLLNAIPKTLAPQYLGAIPKQSFDHQAMAEVLSLQRAVSVPLGISTPEEPNISSTIWRTVSDQKNLVYYFDSATSPNTFWVSLGNLDFKPGASVRKLLIQNGEIYAGEAAPHFKEAQAFSFSVPPAASA
ncbi:MAG: linear amide C-N hydrolase [Neisseriaceae bacterium]|nr:linear amide C-N hydrolase [Neisseriaceae bacterium]